MPKLTIGVLAFVIASSASAAGWRSLRIDGSSEEAFHESVIAFRDKLPYVRQHVFERSLQDIWVEGVKAAQAAGRAYTVTDYLRDVDGLKYKEVVLFTDPSGATAERYWDQGFVALNMNRNNVAPGGMTIRSGPTHGGVNTFSGSKTLDAGQSYRAEGRLGGNHF